MLRHAEAANEAHIAAFEALGEMGKGDVGGVHPPHGPRVIPPKFGTGAPPPPPPVGKQPVPEPSGPPPSRTSDHTGYHGGEEPTSTPTNTRLKTGWKNRMCALITALDMNLTDRVKALTDVFLE